MLPQKVTPILGLIAYEKLNIVKKVLAVQDDPHGCHGPNVNPPLRKKPVLPKHKK